MFIVAGLICTRVHLYTMSICTDVAIIDVCPYLLLVAACALYYWLGVLHLLYASM